MLNPWNITRTHEIAVEIGKALILNSFNTHKKKDWRGFGREGCIFSRRLTNFRMTTHIWLERKHLNCPTDNINTTLVNAGNRAVCLLKDWSKSSRLGRTIQCDMLRFVSMQCDLIWWTQMMITYDYGVDRRNIFESQNIFYDKHNCHNGTLDLVRIDTIITIKTAISISII